MENWDEVRTAWQVARLGTVSGAAEVLGVHHATVIRHIDALEKRLGAKLFQRHAKGYTPTEAGQDLLKVAAQTHENLAQLASRIRGQGEVVSGELVVTAVSGLSDLLVPVLARFQARFPDVTIRFLTDLRVFRLEQGEAHVAVRAGQRPQEADYVVQSFCRLPTALYAARSYITTQGMPVRSEDFAAHRFIGVEGPLSRAPFYRWLEAQVPASAFSLRVTDVASVLAALRAGMGIGFVSPQDAALYPELVEVMASIPEWDSPLWIVTHVDLHRTLKVQSFLSELKSAATGWTTA